MDNILSLHIGYDKQRESLSARWGSSYFTVNELLRAHVLTVNSN